MHKLRSFLGIALATFAVSASGATFTVINTGNAGAGSLRQAILDANAAPGADTIAFAIGSGAQTIAPTAALPSVTGTTTFDGTTQPGYTGTPLIAIDGAGAGAGNNGLVLMAASSTVTGLVVTNFNQYQIAVYGANCAIRRSYVGIGADGQSANSGGFAVLVSAAGAVIGAPGDGNLIGSPMVVGGATSVTADASIRNNTIGLNAAGTAISGTAFISIITTPGSNQSTIVNNLMIGRIFIRGNVAVRGNRIGVYTSGVALAPFDQNSHPSSITAVGGSVVIGGTLPGDGNELAGAIVLDEGISGTVIRQTDLHDSFAGTIDLRNANQTLIAGNTVRNCNSVAVRVQNGTGNNITGNSFFGNQVGIILGTGETNPFNDQNDGDAGPNLTQNYPVLTAIGTSPGGMTTLSGTLNSTPNSSFRIELFANDSCSAGGFGEGKNFAGTANMSTDATGNGSFNATLPSAYPAGTIFTATATDAAGNTSGFSTCNPSPGPGKFVWARRTTFVSEGAHSVSLEVVRTSGNTGTVTVDFTCRNLSAISGQDYNGYYGTLTFLTGETSKILTFNIIDDAVHEGEEAFDVQLLNPTGGATVPTDGSQDFSMVVITDDDPLPTLSAADVRVDEGDTGTATVQFHVTLSAPSLETVTVQYFTGPGTATSPEDFQPASGTLTFAPGETEKIVSVSVIGDRRYEPDETFFLYFSSISTNSATIGRNPVMATIANDDPSAAITVSDLQLAEGNGGQTLASITLTSNAPITGQLNFATSDGTAHAGSDYQAVGFGTVTFAGETSKTIVIPIVADSDPEPDETFTITFGQNSTGATLNRVALTVTILNDDAGFGPRTQTVALGQKANLVLSLGATPAAPLTVHLTSSNPDVLTVPATLVVTAATTSIDRDTLAIGTTNVVAELPPPYAGSFQALVNVYEPASLVITPSPIALRAGESLTLSASFVPASSRSSIVTLAAADKSILDVPPSININAGQTTTFTITALKSGSTALVATLGADHGGQQSTFFVDVAENQSVVTLQQVTPNNGPMTGGTAVTLAGANFTAGCTLQFGGAAATGVAIVNSSFLTAITPAHAAGAVDLALTCGTQTVTFAHGFTYQAPGPSVAGVQPATGTTSGGTIVRITGANFTAFCWPFFGDVAARNAQLVSPTELLADTPAHDAGRVPVALRCTDSAGASLADAFTFAAGADAQAAIDSMTPGTGAPGESVTLKGSHFRADDVVKFNGVAATILSTSPDTDVIRIPDLPAGKATIALTDVFGRSVSIPNFTVLEPHLPQITSAAPSPARVGADLVLEGTGFRPPYSFALGNARAYIVSLDHARVVLRVPQVPAGSYPANVINAAGNIASIGPSVTVVADLSVLSVTPGCSPASGGGTMTIRGTGFGAATTVTFDGAAVPVTFVDANTLRATIPAGTPGAPRIVIRNPDGAEVSLSDAFTYSAPFDPNGGCAGGRPRGVKH